MIINNQKAIKNKHEVKFSNSHYTQNNDKSFFVLKRINRIRFNISNFRV